MIEKPTIRSPEFREAFSNLCKARVGDNDCELIFSFETEDTQGKAVIVDQAKIVMTPRSLKILQIVLNNLVPAFEKAVGPISLPPGKAEQIAAAILAPAEPAKN